MPATLLPILLGEENYSACMWIGQALDPHNRARLWPIFKLITCSVAVRGKSLEHERVGSKLR